MSGSVKASQPSRLSSRTLSFVGEPRRLPHVGRRLPLAGCAALAPSFFFAARNGPRSRAVLVVEFMLRKSAMKRPVPELTVEELQCAMLAGAGAYDAKTEGRPPAGEAEETVGGSLDSPISRFIVAIDTAFSRAPKKAQAAIERVLFVARDALRDPRAAPFVRRPSTGGMLDVHQSLLEAIARVPLFYGEPAPLERIFALAEEIRQRLEPGAASPRAPEGRRR